MDKYKYIISNDERNILEIIYDWREDFLLTKLEIKPYILTPNRERLADKIWFHSSLESARAVWHRTVGWGLVDGTSVVEFIHSNPERNIEPVYMKYNRLKKPINLKYFILLHDCEASKIELFRRLPVT